MSTTKKNSYAKKAAKDSLMGLTASLKNAGEKNKDGIKVKIGQLVLGGIGGGLMGIVTGRASLLLGLAVTGAGHFMDSPSTAMFGVGMMASGGYQTVAGTLSGNEAGGVDGIKERFENFKNNLKRQLFLDKLKAGKKNKQETDAAKTETTNGLGNLDFSEAERIEQQIDESARQFESGNSRAGMQGIDGVEDHLL